MRKIETEELVTKELVTKAQMGDAASFEALCLRFEPLMKKTAWQAHVRSIYEEALATARLAFVEAVVAYRGESGVPFAGFAASKVRYAVWNLFKRERRRWNGELTLDAGAGDGDSETLADRLVAPGDGIAAVEDALCRGIVTEALGVLPARQRAVVESAVLGDRSLTETATMLGITPQGAFNLKKRALKRIKEFFIEQGNL